MFQALHEFCSVAQRKPVTSIPENLIYRNHEGVSIKLGRWMHTQNKLHRNGKLRQDRVLRFHTDLINAGLFCWPMTRGTRNSFVNKQQQNMHNFNMDNGINQQHSQQQQQQLLNGHNMLSSDPSLLLNKNNLHPLSDGVFSSGLSLTAHAALAARQQQQMQQQQQQQQVYRQQQQQYAMNNAMNMAVNENKNMLMNMDSHVQQHVHNQYNNLSVLSNVLGGTGLHNALGGLDDDSSVSTNEND
jgi:hypothetical protein